MVNLRRCVYLLLMLQMREITYSLQNTFVTMGFTMECYQLGQLVPNCAARRARLEK